MAAEEGCAGLVLTGHIGKLIKVSGGIMNTHSKWADCRMELMAAAALRAGFSAERAKDLLACVTADDALSRCSVREREALMGHLNLRAGKAMAVETVVFSKVYGILGKTAGADEMARRYKSG